MRARKFCKESDYDKVHHFLMDCYRENKNITYWPPERFDDLMLRVNTLYRDERGMLASQDYIYIFEERDVIIGVSYEQIFGAMLDLAEKELLPLFQPDENGMIDFLVISHDSLIYQSDELVRRGYVKDKAEDYDNVQKPMETNYQLSLPDGYRQVYGELLNENRKAKACHYGFHPEDDDGILEGDFREGIKSYHARKRSKFYHDSFESLIVTEDGDICTYSFCYVNKELGTAFIEPICTREKYRGKGLCRQMLYGIINRLKEMRIESVYINSYDWRKKVYNSAGFRTVDSIGFWHRKIVKGIIE